jgi:hypothetical protein
MPNPSPRRPPMNRSQRRAQRRRLLAAMHSSGCRCRPRIEPDPIADAGTAESGSVEHEMHCPLARRLGVASLFGPTPTLWITGVPRCER